MLRINVALLRAYLPAMNERGRGVVVNLSSGWGRIAAPEQSPHRASKFAVEALTGSVAQEVADGVCVIALNPGVIATDMLATAFRGEVSGYPGPPKRRATSPPCSSPSTRAGTAARLRFEACERQRCF